MRAWFNHYEQFHEPTENRRRFYYGRATGNLSYHPTGMLSASTHTVEIVASGEQGRSTANKSWTFTVSQ